jgi:flagella basal body P-ring formation protein FlgA
MNLRSPFLIVLALAASRAAGSPVRIHLPREAVVSGTNLSLGAVAVVVGDDPALQKAVQNLAMGRAPWARETIVLTRPMVLSRLASCGLTPAQVTLSGAEQVCVRRKERLFPGEEVAQAAEKFLKSLPGTGAGKWRMRKKPAELSVPGGVDVQLQARLTGTPAGDSITVRVVATDGKEDLAAEDVTFQRAYTVRQAVAVKDIPAGEALTAENTRIEEVDVDRPPTGAWLPAPMTIAASRIPRGTVIRPALVDQPKAEVLVRRNQTIVMRITGEGFSVSALAEALQDGRQGEYIKVRNVDSKRIVIGKVMPDGTVQPKCDEVSP